MVSTQKRPVPLEHFLYTGNSAKTSNELFMIVDAQKKFKTEGYARFHTLGKTRVWRMRTASRACVRNIGCAAAMPCLRASVRGVYWGHQTARFVLQLCTFSLSLRYNKAISAKKERASKVSQSFGAKGTRHGAHPSQVSSQPSTHEQGGKIH